MANTHIIATDSQNLTGAYTASRIFKSPLSENSTSMTLISDTAYFVFVGRTAQVLTPQYVEFYNTGGVGAQTAEVGLFYTANPPTRNTAQTMNKIVATGTVDDLTGTGVKRNTGAFSTAVASGTYLWAGLRTAMADTQPAPYILLYDFEEGFVLSCAGAGALTGAGPWTGSIVAFVVASNPVMPALRVTLD